MVDMTIPAGRREELLRLLRVDPLAIVGAIAEELEADHRRMAPRQILAYRTERHSFALGRHEVPGLALTARRYDPASAGAAETVDRIAGYVRHGEIRG